jgi:hypothetical protein
VEWSGVEWSGVEWSGVEWSGVEWIGLDWIGLDWMNSRIIGCMCIICCRKLQEIYDAVQNAIPEDVICFRSQHAVTLISKFPYRHIQIVLRLYKSPAEILMGFDVDSCAVGFDGSKAWVMPRTHRALTLQYNTVDMLRRSPTYEMRLAKYSKRGFEILVPVLSPSHIDPQIFERRFEQLQGLARLLVIERLEAPEYRTRYKEQQRLRRLRPEAAQRQSFWTQLDPNLDDDYNRERIEEGGASSSDYSTVFLPWGPKWSAERIRKLMYTKDMILNSKWYDPNKKHHTHPCFFGTASEVIQDCCKHCPPIPPKDVGMCRSLTPSLLPTLLMRGDTACVVIGWLVGWLVVD